MGRLSMHSWTVQLFSLGLDVFSSSSQRVLKFPNVFRKTFPIARGFYLIWFAQSWTPMYINWKGEIQGSTFCFYFAARGSLGACPMFQKIADGPINMAPLLNWKKSCECTYDLIKMNEFRRQLVVLCYLPITPVKHNCAHLQQFFHFCTY
jgi:hypothetical protein